MPTSLIHRRANKQYVAMTNDEMWEFLESKDRLFVAFPTESGYPHVTPIWFCVLDGKIYLRTQDYKVKSRLAAQGKVCCSIDEGRSYRDLRGIVLWGKCQVLTDQELVQRVSNAISIRYKEEQWKESEMPKDWVHERKKERRTYIEIIPEKVSSWDNTKIARPVRPEVATRSG